MHYDSADTCQKSAKYDVQKMFLDVSWEIYKRSSALVSLLKNILR